MEFLKKMFGQPGLEASSEKPEAADFIPDPVFSSRLVKASEEIKKNLPESVSAFDKLGRRVQIKRQDWNENVLPEMIKNAWDSASDLYRAINAGIDAGSFEEVKAGAEQLSKIDTNPERGAVVYATSLSLVGEYDDAVKVLTDYIGEDDNSPAAMTALARIYLMADNEDEAFGILDKSVNLHPNQDEALSWYIDLVRRRENEAKVQSELARLADFDDSWLPSLMLGKIALEQDDDTAAMAHFEKALDRSDNNANVISTVSGELGQKQKTKEVIQHILPRYNPESHGPVPGLNFVQSLIVEGYIDVADDLLHRVAMHNMDSIRGHVMQLTSQLSNIKRQAFYQERAKEAQENPPTEAPVVEFMKISMPLWFYPLNEPYWLLPSKNEDAKRVYFSALHVDNPQDVKIEPEIEHALAGLTTSIPLFFKEVASARLDLRTATFIPVIKDQGPIVRRSEWPQDQKQKIASLDEVNPDYLVTGGVRFEGPEKEAVITFNINDIDGNIIETIVEKGSGNELHLIIAAAFEAVTAFVTGNSDDKLLDPVPPAPLVQGYLQSLSHQLAYFMTWKGILPMPALFNRRELLESFYAFAVNSGVAEMSKIFFYAALEYDRVLAGRSYLEFGHKAFALAKTAKPGTAFHQTSPFILATYKRQDELKEILKTIPEEAPVVYRNWMASLVDLK